MRGRNGRAWAAAGISATVASSTGVYVGGPCYYSYYTDDYAVGDTGASNVLGENVIGSGWVRVMIKSTLNTFILVR